MKKGCLGCLSVLAIVTVSLVALVSVRVWLFKVRVERGAELSAAVQAGDVERVDQLLGFGRRWLLNKDDALVRVAGGGLDEHVRRLIAAGAEIDRSPLIEAAKGGHATTAAILLEAGADPNAVNYPDPVASFLQDAVVNVLGFWFHGQQQWEKHSRPSYYPAALHSAIEHGHTDVAALLIHAGANVLAPGLPVGEESAGGRMTAVEKARFLGQADMVALLDSAVELPLAINVLNAAQAGDWERLSRVVALGADVNAQAPPEDKTPWERWTPLNFAARAGRGEIVALLLAHGATGDAYIMRDALIGAASSGDSLAVAQLLRAGAADFVQGEEFDGARDAAYRRKASTGNGGAWALLDSVRSARR